MTIPSRFLEDLKERVDLPGLIGARVKLTRRGRDHVGLCPFHNEKTPSFNVVGDKHFYHCFGCGAHGSAIDFVMQTEGLSFPEAVERLAATVGMAVPEMSREERDRAERRATLSDVTEAAADYFHQRLMGPDGAVAREYLTRRGVTDRAIERFRLGYAPDGSRLLDHLKTKGMDAGMAVAAGLAKQPEDGRAPFAFFRDRLMFPIADRKGRIVSFGARALRDEQQPKYINGTDTELFHKSHVLYGLDTARAAAHKTGRVLVVEGYMDVIGLWQVGIEHAVAPLGTALTEGHLEVLWRLAPEPVLCLDGDAAGRRAALKAAERALPGLKPGHSLRFAWMPQGEDPDSLAKNGGRAGIEEVLAKPKGMAEVLADNVLATATLDTPEAKAMADKQMKDLAFRVEDETVRGYYLRYFKDRMWQATGGARRKPGASRRFSPGGRGSPGRYAGGPGRGRPEPLLPPVSSLDAAGHPVGRTDREREIVSMLLAHPEMIGAIEEEAAELSLLNQDLDKALRGILEAASWQGSVETRAVVHHLEGLGLTPVAAALLETLDRCDPRLPRGAPDDPDWQRDWRITTWRKTVRRARRDAVEADLRAAEADWATASTEANLARLNALQATLKRLDEAGERDGI